MLKNKSNVTAEKVEKMPSQFYSANEKKSASDMADGKKGINRFRLAAAGVTTVLTIATATSAVLISGLSVGYTVEVDNTVVGKVATKNAYYEVLDEVKSEVNGISDVEFEAEGKENFRIELVRKSDLTDKSELAENLKSTTEGMTEAVSITVDGVFLAAVPESHEAHNLLERYLLQYSSEAENITTEFAQKIEVTTGLVPEESVQTAEEVYETLIAGKTVTHTVAADETLEEIANVYGTTEKDIAKTNDVKKAEEGMVLTVHTEEPVLSIRTTEHVSEETEIPFETIRKEDADLYEGRTEVKKAGVPGKAYKESYVTKINGEVVEEEIVREEVLEEPETQVESVGTKEAPPSVGSGNFQMPSTGKFSSPFGPRWGRMHTGIDIAAKTGTPIYASDNGIVTEAQYKNNGYGNLIVVDHGNGFVTYYAHCSAIDVKVGDIVAKGDLIGKIGSTGRSTGAHLHFEVRVNGEPKDPMKYIKE